jgi:hypothetical protein
MKTKILPFDSARQNLLIRRIVLVNVNIIAVYDLWKSSDIVYYQITQLCDQKYRLATPFAEHNFGPFERIFFVVVLFESLSKNTI